MLVVNVMLQPSVPAAPKYRLVGLGNPGLAVSPSQYYPLLFMMPTELTLTLKASADVPVIVAKGLYVPNSWPGKPIAAVGEVISTTKVFVVPPSIQLPALSWPWTPT